ncbi:hypothetical protein V8C42DRAFT_331760 [Trichoderma barbatum]
MKSIDSTDDVIAIESSDSDSDCRIVKIAPSPARRGKNKSKWQNKSSGEARGAVADRRGREMTMRQLNAAVYEDRHDMSSASREDAKRLSRGLMAARGGLQGTTSTTANNLQTRINDTYTQTDSSSIQHVDLEEPFSIERYMYVADINATRISCPPLWRSEECKQEPPSQEDEGEEENEDEDGHERRLRSRSGSTATLDFSPERQRRKSSERDAQEFASMPDGASESLELLDTRHCTTLNACTKEAISHNSGCPTPTRETSLEKAASALLTIEHQDEEKALEKNFSSESINALPQPHKETLSESRRQLHQTGRWPTWKSVINVAALEALPGPLFTRPKQVLDTVTYEAVMEEKAANERKQTL